MQRQRGELVPIGDALSGLGGPMKALAKTSPQALIPSPPTQRHFTRADQVHQLVSASEADPDRGFMARTMALCSLPRTNPGNRHQYKRQNGPYTLYMDQRGHLNRMLRLALPFFVDATCCAQTLAQMRRHPELAVWVRDSCLHEPHRRSSRDRSGWP